MKEWLDRNRATIACAAIAFIIGAIAAGNIAASYEYRTSSLVRMAIDDPIAKVAAETDPSFVFFSGGTHYDGIYFYAIARDPLALGTEHKLIDLPGARYGHPLYGWLAAVFSFGDPGLIPPVLLAINLVAIAALAAAVSLLAKDLGWTPWAGLIVPMNPGLIYAITVDTSEVVGNLLMVLAFLTWFRGKRVIAGGLLIALCLAKEPYVLVPAALFLWELFQWWKGRPAADIWKRLTTLTLGPIALLIWEIHLRFVLGFWAFEEDFFVLSIPFVGWAETITMSGVANNGIDFNQFQIESAVAPILIPLGIAMVAAAICAGRLRTPIDLVVIGMVLLNFSLTWLNLFYMKDLIRQMSTIFLLLPYAFAGVKAGAPYLARSESRRRAAQASTVT